MVLGVSENEKWESINFKGSPWWKFETLKIIRILYFSLKIPVNKVTLTFRERCALFSEANILRHFEVKIRLRNLLKIDVNLSRCSEVIKKD